MNNLDHSINKFKNYSFSYTKPIEPASFTSTSFKHRHKHVEEDYEKDTDKNLAKSKDLR